MLLNTIMRRKCSNITFCHFYIHIHVHVPSQCFCYFYALCFCCSFVYLFCCCCCYYCCLFQLCTYHMNLLYTCYEGTLCLFSLFVCLFWGCSHRKRSCVGIRLECRCRLSCRSERHLSGEWIM